MQRDTYLLMLHHQREEADRSSGDIIAPKLIGKF